MAMKKAEKRVPTRKTAEAFPQSLLHGTSSIAG